MRKYVDAARITGRKNLDGRLAVSATAGLPFLLREGMEVHLVPPVVDAPRDVVVEDVAMQGDLAAVVALSDVKDADVADMLVGCHCLVARDEVEGALAEESIAAAPLLAGWTFADETSGERGVVVSAAEMPAQVMLTVALDGREGEHLVPLVDEFVVSDDADAAHLILRLPQGIFDL